jgi:hypothetical protein
MRKILDFIVLLLLVPITFFGGAFLYIYETRIFSQQPLSPFWEYSGIGAIPTMGFALIIILIIFALLKNKVRMNEYGLLALIYIPIMIIAMHPKVVFWPPFIFVRIFGGILGIR